ncbi:hypothetical protein PIB30_011343 [Stylosanthes scabra]|uniref:Uncharacterized protein n=1 Tax=Stylosanthes scabra TaxID=79078 RepID=A0ABU6W5T6_9FABA|nr:hypothetical protein [Stylosanthes scabra]
MSLWLLMRKKVAGEIAEFHIDFTSINAIELMGLGYIGEKITCWNRSDGRLRPNYLGKIELLVQERWCESSDVNSIVDETSNTKKLIDRIKRIMEKKIMITDGSNIEIEELEEQLETTLEQEERYWQDGQGGWLYSESDIGEKAQSYFQQVFTEGEHVDPGPILADMHTNVMTAMNRNLLSPLIDIEIRRAVFSISSDQPLVMTDYQ